MTPARRRLAALIAAFAPDRAEQLIALVSAGSSDFPEHAAALARRPREERLAALAAAFSSATLAESAAPGFRNPLWQRLVREALGRRSRPSRPYAPRTGVRGQDGSRLPHGEVARENTPSQGGTLDETPRLR
jgi:hypothetical protein